jgi:hypothetical protein
MIGSLRRSGLLAAVVAILGAGYSVTAMAHQPTMVSVAPRPTQPSKRSLFGNPLARPGLYGRKGAGISMAQQQRAAAKRRGIARNRRNRQ